MRKLLLVLMMVICCIYLLSGCTCEHEWEDADCTTPKTCEECGETDGEALGHEWDPATCNSPKVCKVCNQTEGSHLEHNWENATCTKPATCSACGEEKGEALGHTITEWVVTAESTCSKAGTESGTCTICNKTIEQPAQLKEHTPGEWEITTEPTATTLGVKTQVCTVCNEVLKQESFTMSPEELERQYKDRCESISYDDLSRSPGKYEGTYVKFYGQVVQICSEATSSAYYSTYRVATYKGYDNVVYIYVDNYGSGERILEDDWITFYGKFDGLYTYTTVRGDKLSIPSVKVAYIE